MYDYHTHSDFSEDCFTPMSEMVEAAFQKGIKEIAITDHYDPDYPDPDFPFEINFKEYHKTLLRIQKSYSGQIKVIKGLEIGIQSGATLKKCTDAANNFPYDFLIGSFHTAYNDDLYSQYFKHRNIPDGIRDFYLYMLDCLKTYNDFDVLGHFNVIDRYSDALPDYSPYMETIENILKVLIDHGKGIEFNTSSFRYGMGERTTPSKEILALYKALGGEIITIGSDAHKTKYVGANYDVAIEILKSHGFKYLSTFKNRKINFVKL